jgi:hypothetical protein
MAKEEEEAMIKILAGIGLLLMGTGPSLAQDYCEQVRQGVAQYGYAAARQYAVEHYSAKEVKAADRCVAKLHLRHG